MQFSTTEIGNWCKVKRWCLHVYWCARANGCDDRISMAKKESEPAKKNNFLN